MLLSIKNLSVSFRMGKVDGVQQRADAVANYLKGNGVNPARITSTGFGPANPVASNDTDLGRAQNRRVEIKLTPMTEGSTKPAN